MKQLFIIILLLTLTSPVTADCLGEPTYCVWPVGNRINKSPLIIFNSGDTSIANKVSGNYSLYLVSIKSNKKIELKLNGLNLAGLNMIQLFFSTSLELIEGETYKLVHYFKGKKTDLFTTKDQYSQKEVNYKWTVFKSPQQRTPQWIESPIFSNKIYRWFGCGPQKELFFKFNYDSAEKIIVKAIITSKATKKTYICYMPDNNGLVRLGHNMWSGEFNFADGGDFDVIFCVLNESGLSSTQSRPISFSEPTPENEN
jgi:hypothetical protein